MGSEGAVQEDFEEFLRQNKIDIQALKDSGKTKDHLNAEDKRITGILQARLEAYPFSSQEIFRMKIDTLGHMMEHLQAECLGVCEQDNMVPILSLQEGFCLRNCMSKFSNAYSLLGRNMESTNANYLYNEYMETQAKKDPAFRKELQDPWAQERDSYI